MSDVARLVADHLDIWTTATERRGAGRGGGKRVGFYGVERLRALILDLAVRGRLVPQDAGDEPASELLKRMGRAKVDLVRSRTIRQPRMQDQGGKLVPPFAIPLSWTWARLDEIGAIVGGGTPSSTNSDNYVEGGCGTAWLTPADLGQFRDRYISHGERDLTTSGLQSSSATVMPAGTILFSSRAPIGYVAIASGPITTNQGFKSVVPYVGDCSLFIATALKAFAPSINENAPGTTFKEVSGKAVAGIPFPVPPLAEQKRIVAKVDELMALCDALERESADALTAHQTLVEVLLAALVASHDAAVLSAEWSRTEECFDVLFTTEVSIDALKATLLELAVRGKLSPNTPTGGWTTSELHELIGPMDSGWSPACHEFPARSEETWGVLKTTAVQYLSYEADQNKELPEKLSPRPDAECKAGDVLITRAGPTNRVGVCCVVKATRPRLMISDKIIRFRPKPKVVDGSYLALSLSIGPAANQIERAKSGMAASQVNISQTKLRAVKVSIPSLPEQRRIVAKVDELTALCDALKAQIAVAGATARHLADAVVERVAV